MFFKNVINGISDLKFVNEYINRSTGSAIAFIMFWFLTLTVALFAVKAPAYLANFSEFEGMYDTVPDFTVVDGLLAFDDGRSYYETSTSQYKLIFDLEDKTRGQSELLTSNIFHVTQSHIYLNETMELLDFENFKELEGTMDKNFFSTMIDVMRIAGPLFIVFVYLFMFVFAVLILNLATRILAFFKGLRLRPSDSLKITLYSMTFPMVFVFLVQLLSIYVPNIFLLYLIFTSVYIFIAVNNYEEPKKVDILI